MDRKGGAYHVDMDSRKGSPQGSCRSRRESLRPGSASSSELSDTSSIGKRKSSAPKVVAVVIVSLIIVAGLVGVTIYLIDIEKEKQELMRLERLEEGKETEIDFLEASERFDGSETDYEVDSLISIKSSESAKMTSSSTESARMAANIRQKEKQLQDIQRKRFLENFQRRQEEFLRPTEEEEAIISSLISERKTKANNDNNDDIDLRRKEKENPELQTTTKRIAYDEGVTSQDLEFGGVGLFGKVSKPVTNNPPATEEISNHRLTTKERDEKTSEKTMTMQTLQEFMREKQDIYNMADYVKLPGRTQNNRPRKLVRQRQRVLRPGLEGFRRLDSVGDETMRQGLILDDQLAVSDIAVNQYIQKVPGAELNAKPMNGFERNKRPRNKPEKGGETGLPTIDRRPGRPAFHHQGPPSPGGRPANRLLNRRLMTRKNRQPTAMRIIQDKLQTKEKSMVENLLQGNVEEQHDSILNNFDTFLKLAASELGSLRTVAKNITQSGRDVNLWEVLKAVNNTVRGNPNSNVAQLMSKFENKYLNEDINPSEAVYERSLSSLLFLSMGIFLLNSVNELVESGSLPGVSSQGRSMPTNVALEHLVKDSNVAEEVLQLFNSSVFDIFQHEEGGLGNLGERDGEGEDILQVLEPGSAGTTVNNYLRLLMNLVNAYIHEGSEFECIYAAYCVELNQQAKLEGMASSVAKINSVGLQLAMKQLQGPSTLAALARNMWQWQDLDCQHMFPQCDIPKETTKVEFS